MAKTPDSETKVLVSIKKKSGDKLRKVSILLNKTLGGLAEEAIDKVYDPVLYNLQTFKLFCESNPSMSAYANSLREEFSGMASEFFKSIMTLKEDCNSKINFSHFFFPDNEEEIKKLFENDIYDSIAVVKMNSKDAMKGELLRLSKLITECPGQGLITSRYIESSGATKDKLEIFFFICDKKEGKHVEK